jgi:hypothetical protein
MIGPRPEVETFHYPVSEAAAKYRASARTGTDDPGEAYADCPGEYLLVRLAWPPDSDANA